MAIKIGAINTGKPGNTVHSYPAAPTHTRTVNHDWIQANDGINAKWLGGLGAEFHHDAGANGNNPVNLLS